MSFLSDALDNNDYEYDNTDYREFAVSYLDDDGNGNVDNLLSLFATKLEINLDHLKLFNRDKRAAFLQNITFLVTNYDQLSSRHSWSEEAIADILEDTNDLTLFSSLFAATAFDRELSDHDLMLIASRAHTLLYVNTVGELFTSEGEHLNTFSKTEITKLIGEECVEDDVNRFLRRRVSRYILRVIRNKAFKLVTLKVKNQICHPDFKVLLRKIESKINDGADDTSLINHIERYLYDHQVSADEYEELEHFLFDYDKYLAYTSTLKSWNPRLNIYNKMSYLFTDEFEAKKQIFKLLENFSGVAADRGRSLFQNVTPLSEGYCPIEQFDTITEPGIFVIDSRRLGETKGVTAIDILRTTLKSLPSRSMVFFLVPISTLMSAKASNVTYIGVSRINIVDYMDGFLLLHLCSPQDSRMGLWNTNLKQQAFQQYESVLGGLIRNISRYALVPDYYYLIGKSNLDGDPNFGEMCTITLIPNEEDSVDLDFDFADMDDYGLLSRPVVDQEDDPGDGDGDGGGDGDYTDYS